MLRCCEACSKCSLYFLACLTNNILVKTGFVSYLKLSLPVFFKCLLIFA